MQGGNLIYAGTKTPHATAQEAHDNLMLTMALGGLWHGAQWHFMVWGVYQGVLLCGHRLWSRSIGTTASAVTRTASTRLPRRGMSNSRQIQGAGPAAGGAP